MSQSEQEQSTGAIEAAERLVVSNTDNVKVSRKLSLPGSTFDFAHPNHRRPSHIGSMHLFLSSHHIGGNRIHESSSSIDKAALAKPLFRKDIFLSRTSIPTYADRDDHGSHMSNLSSIKERNETQLCCCPKDSIDALKTILDFSVLKVPSLQIVLACNVLSFAGMHAPFMYITDFSAKQGIPAIQASVLISIIGKSYKFKILYRY